MGWGEPQEAQGMVIVLSGRGFPVYNEDTSAIWCWSSKVVAQAWVDQRKNSDKFWIVPLERF